MRSVHARVMGAVLVASTATACNLDATTPVDEVIDTSVTTAAGISVVAERRGWYEGGLVTPVWVTVVNLGLEPTVVSHQNMVLVASDGTRFAPLFAEDIELEPFASIGPLLPEGSLGVGAATAGYVLFEPIDVAIEGPVDLEAIFLDPRTAAVQASVTVPFRAP